MIANMGVLIQSGVLRTKVNSKLSRSHFDETDYERVCTHMKHGDFRSCVLALCLGQPNIETTYSTVLPLLLHSAPMYRKWRWLLQSLDEAFDWFEFRRGCTHNIYCTVKL
jgi:hypothetical protein